MQANLLMCLETQTPYLVTMFQRKSVPTPVYLPHMVFTLCKAHHLPNVST